MWVFLFSVITSSLCMARLKIKEEKKVELEKTLKLSYHWLKADDRHNIMRF